MLIKKWLHGAIPALLIHGCIGTVYCWSLLYDYIHISIPNRDCTWAFSLAIFFLGISAAFFGPLVEKNVKKAAILSAVLFSSGMILSGIACQVSSLLLLYLGYGVIMGTGVGVGYISPVKTLMMWFQDNKGLATGLAIMGFGLAKVLATPLLNNCIENHGISSTFFIFGSSYLIIMMIAAGLLKKPEEATNKSITEKNKFSMTDWIKRKKELLSLPEFKIIWLIFFLNIASGLSIISYEKYFYDAAGIGVVIGLVFSAIFNSAGRFGVAWWSDYFKNRGKLFGIILTFSVISGITAFVNPGFIAVAVLMCNAGYGAMFSIMPSVLADKYGMKNVSEIHGLVLSAWAIAGLCGNQMANLLVGIPESSYKTVMLGSVVLYCIALSLSTKLWEKR